MTLNIEKVIRKARPVEAVKVTEENLHEVAGWCNGLVVPVNGLGGNNTKPYVHVSVRNPRRESDNQAFPEMWVIREDFRSFRVITNKQYKNSYEDVVKQRPATPSPTPKTMAQQVTPKQVGAVEVVPGTPADEGSPLTTGTVQTVHRSAEDGQFVTQAEADANPATTVEETIETQEDAVDTNDGFNHDALASQDIVPGDMVAADQPEADPDGTVQLGVPIEGAPELCGSCGSQVVAGVCSADIEHNINGTAVETEAPAAPRILPGD